MPTANINDCKSFIKTDKDLYNEYGINNYNDLEKALKQAKAFDVIKEKDVVVSKIRESKNVDEYNDFVIQFWGYSLSVGKLLTQEEFDLLKEVLEDDK